MKVSVSAYQRWSSSNSRASTSILPLYPKATLPSLGVIKAANLVQSTSSLLSQGLVCLRNSQPTETKPGLKRFEKHYLQQMPDRSKAAKSNLICPYVLAYLREVLVFHLLMTTASLELGLVLKGHQADVEWQGERERKERKARGEGCNLSYCGFMRVRTMMQETKKKCAARGDQETGSFQCLLT